MPWSLPRTTFLTLISEEMNANVIVVILPPGRPKAKSPLGGQQAGVSQRSVGAHLCRRAAPRLGAPGKKPPRGMSLDAEQSLRTMPRLANPSDAGREVGSKQASA